ncbi:MAG: hypothetical protein IOD12_06660 [Silvanigrellales bacterium]|nr:hypothetical protein [Silvanigrellales bacterium]
MRAKYRVLTSPSCLATVICLACLSLASCLKANGGIEIVDSSLGQATATPRATLTPTAEPLKSFVELYVSDVSAYLSLSAADAQAFNTATREGIASTSVTGEAATSTLETLVKNTVAWLKEKDKVKGDLQARTAMATRILLAGYVATRELASASRTTLRESHVRAVANPIAAAFTEVFSPSNVDVVANYALFASNIVSLLMNSLRDEDSVSAADLLTHSTWLVGEMAGALKGQLLLGSGSAFAEAYCRETGAVVIKELAGDAAATQLSFRSAYATDIMDSLEAIYTSGTPTLSECYDAMDEGLASAL